MEIQKVEFSEIEQRCHEFLKIRGLKGFEPIFTGFVYYRYCERIAIDRILRLLLLRSVILWNSYTIVDLWRSPEVSTNSRSALPKRMNKKRFVYSISAFKSVNLMQIPHKRYLQFRLNCDELEISVL